MGAIAGALRKSIPIFLERLVTLGTGAVYYEITNNLIVG